MPIHNEEFDSNWELSSARATRVARIFVDTHHISPGKLSAAGYGEYHPVAPNDTGPGRAENRRVDLIVMPRTRMNLSWPNADAAKGAWKKITE
jgi:chemotaxis protein MotB